MRRVLRENGLSIVLFALFLLFIIGQSLAGHAEYNEDHLTTDPREQLQTTFGTAYTLERELGGGGMSRVFVAVETALGRRMVVKVLPPGMRGPSALSLARPPALLSASPRPGSPSARGHASAPRS